MTSHELEHNTTTTIQYHYTIAINLPVSLHEITSAVVPHQHSGCHPIIHKLKPLSNILATKKLNKQTDQSRADPAVDKENGINIFVKDD